jgi:hypothetical protein
LYYMRGKGDFPHHAGAFIRGGNLSWPLYNMITNK